MDFKTLIGTSKRLTTLGRLRWGLASLTGSEQRQMAFGGALGSEDLLMGNVSSQTFNRPERAAQRRPFLSQSIY